MAITPTQILSTIEEIGSFIASLYPPAGVVIGIATPIIGAVAPQILSLYNSLFAAKPAGLSDQAWLLVLQSPLMTKTAAQYLAEAQATIAAAAPVLHPVIPPLPVA